MCVSIMLIVTNFKRKFMTYYDFIKIEIWTLKTLGFSTLYDPEACTV